MRMLTMRVTAWSTTNEGMFLPIGASLTHYVAGSRLTMPVVF